MSLTPTPTNPPPSMLSLHIQAESLRWAAAAAASSTSQHPSSPASSCSSPSTLSDSGASLFSLRPLTRRSSVSSLFSDDDAAAAQQLPAQHFAPVPWPQQQQGGSAVVVATYASLDAAVAQSTAAVEALGAPRRLVTPGKLYENEEDDDEIIGEGAAGTATAGG